ncbi:MAG: hypothetical protein U0572_12685 [Phycisphaerales bacterium]
MYPNIRGIARSLACALGALVTTAAIAQVPPQPVVVQPGFQVIPFSGFWAGTQPFKSPKFGVVNKAPPHPPMMFISELGGGVVTMVFPNGMNVPYAPMPAPANPSGIDIDGPVFNFSGNTMGIYGGPPTMGVAEVAPGAVDMILPGGAVAPMVLPPVCQPGVAALNFDRTPNFTYGGFMYVTDWGGDQTDSVMVVMPGGFMMPFAPLPGLDPRYMTFDNTGGATGYGPSAMWVTSFQGPVFSVNPGGIMNPPLAILQPGTEGLSFALGDLCYGTKLYVGNLQLGTIDIVAPNGAVMPFAIGFPGAAYLMFVKQGPYAINGSPTLYVLDGIDTVWAIIPLPHPGVYDLNGDAKIDGADLAILLGAWGPVPPGIIFPPDFNGDGMVDAQDLAVLLGAWGPCLCK